MSSDQEKFSSDANSEKMQDFGYFYDVVKMISGNGISQILRIILSPIISRLFRPEYFGVMQNFSSISNILGVLSTMRYDQSIMLPKKREDAANQFIVSVIFVLFTMPVFIFLFILFGRLLVNSLNSPELMDLLYFIPVYAAILGLNAILKQWNSRNRKYTQLSFSLIISEIFSDGGAVGFGLAGLASSVTLTLSRLIGQIASTFFTAVLILHQDGKFILQQFNFKRIIKGIKTYKKFPIFTVWAAFLSMLSIYLPGMILSGFFTPTIAGYFSFGQSVLRLPISLIGNSIGDVFFQRASQKAHQNKLPETVEETMKQLITIGTFPMLIIMVLGKDLFAIVFGANWGEAGYYSQILSMWTLFIFISQPLNRVVSIVGRNEMALVFGTLKVLVGAISFTVGGLLGNIYAGLWIFSVAGVLLYSGYFYWIAKITGIRQKLVTFHFARKISLSIPFLLILLAVGRYSEFKDIQILDFKIPTANISILLIAFVEIGFYFLISFLRDPTLRSVSRDLIRKIGGKHNN